MEDSVSLEVETFGFCLYLIFPKGYFPLET